MRNLLFILFVSQTIGLQVLAMRTSRTYDLTSPKSPPTPRTPRTPTPRASLVENDCTSLRRSACSEIAIERVYPPILAQTEFADDIRALNLSPRAAPFLVWGLKDITLLVPSIDVRALVKYFCSFWQGNDESRQISPKSCAKTMLFYKGRAYVLCEETTYMFDVDQRQFHAADGFSIVSMQDGFVYAHDGESILRFEDRFGQLIESHNLGLIGSLENIENGFIADSAQIERNSILLRKWVYAFESHTLLEKGKHEISNPFGERQLTLMFVNASHIIAHDGHHVIIFQISSGKVLDKHNLGNITGFVVRHGRLIIRCFNIEFLEEKILKATTQEFALVLDSNLSMSVIQPPLESEKIEFSGFSQALAKCYKIIHAVRKGPNLYLLQEHGIHLYLRHINTLYGVEYEPIFHLVTRPERSDDYFIELDTNAVAMIVDRGLNPF